MEGLRPFGEVDTAAMRWIRTAPDRREFELRAGDALLARLRWEHPVGSLAHAETAEAAWTLKRGGFLQPHVTARVGGTDKARLALHLAAGLLDITGGGQYRFRRAGLLVPAWQFTDRSGKVLVHLEPVAERGRLQGGLVQVDPSAVRQPDLVYLAVMGWYFIVLAWFEDEIAGASSAAMDAVSG
jgi:hypothetical protein